MSQIGDMGQPLPPDALAALRRSQARRKFAADSLFIGDLGAAPSVRDLPTSDLVTQVAEAQTSALEEAVRAMADLGYTPADCLIVHHDGGERIALRVRGVEVFEVVTTIDLATHEIRISSRMLNWPDPVAAPLDFEAFCAAAASQTTSHAHQSPRLVGSGGETG